LFFFLPNFQEKSLKITLVENVAGVGTYFSHHSPFTSSSSVTGSVTESVVGSCLDFLCVLRRMTSIDFSPLVLEVQQRLVAAWGASCYV